MRKSLIPLMALALSWALGNAVLAQDPAQNPTQPAPAPKPAAPSAPSPSAQKPASSDASDQPMSLADMARLARAKKQGDTASAKPAKVVLDDDNMPRGIYAADAPSASAKSSSGTPADSSGPFSEFRGKVVLLDFWASWCGPCRSALPNLKRLQSIYGEDDFVVVSISEDNDEDTWHAFITSHQMTWPQRFDAKGAIQHQFGVNALPTYVLIGRDGNVVQKYVGEDLAASIVERIGPDLRQTLAAKP
jgi:thiol-disulfide isomerase/thioredoxin